MGQNERLDHLLRNVLFGERQLAYCMKFAPLPDSFDPERERNLQGGPGLPKGLRFPRGLPPKTLPGFPRAKGGRCRVKGARADPGHVGNSPDWKRKRAKGRDYFPYDLTLISSATLAPGGPRAGNKIQ